MTISPEIYYCPKCGYYAHDDRDSILRVVYGVVPCGNGNSKCKNPYARSTKGLEGRIIILEEWECQ